MTVITRRADFEPGSAQPSQCLILKRPKTTDEGGIFRCGMIDYERGWLDISEGAVTEMALKLGWGSAEEVSSLKDEVRALTRELKDLRGQVDLSNIEKVIEISTKLSSERRKTRRYKKKIEQLEGEVPADEEPEE